MNQTAPAALPSSRIRNDESVFAGYPKQDPSIASPVFGQTIVWPGTCIERPSNVKQYGWKLWLPVGDPVWNLRAREILFYQLNPTHRAVRDAGLSLKRKPAAFLGVRQTAQELCRLARWSATCAMPTDLSLWDSDAWEEYLVREGVDHGPSARHSSVLAIRRLHTFASALTCGGLPEDPWPKRTATSVANYRRSDDLATCPIAPKTWWALLRAAWTYIHVFAPDLLDFRDRVLEDGLYRPTVFQTAPPERRQTPSHDVDYMVAQWLADPGNLVPVHAYPWRQSCAGEPAWSTLSLVITGGRRSHIFSNPDTPRPAARRALVMQAVQQGRVQPISGIAGVGALGVTVQPKVPARTKRHEHDTRLEQWLVEPGNLIPVHAEGTTGAGEPVWAVIERQVLGRTGTGMFENKSEAARRRRALVEQAAPGRTTPVYSQAAGVAVDILLPCPEFAHVDRADGTRGPWRTEMGVRQLVSELRTLRAAAYIFIAALTLMRDSEIQEIQRGSITTHYGAPAIVSLHRKGEETPVERHWWIIDQVAEAICVLERLSAHATHVFAPLRAPSRDGGERGADDLRGIYGAEDIDLFLARVNATAHETGLEPIPPDHIRPHMFRRTMSIIAAQEQDGEIALGLQLKHAARRTLSNRTTQAYYTADPAWAKEFDKQYRLAAATRLVELLRDRRDGKAVAFGPGAARLHAGLDKVAAKVDADPVLRAQIGSEAVLAALLRDEFPELHWGTLNHCLWNAPTAECQNSLPEDQRGRGPLLGACQPAHCRNSTITHRHMPIWLAEEGDLIAMLRKPKLAQPRRDSLKARLVDVELITDAWRRSRPGNGD